MICAIFMAPAFGVSDFFPSELASTFAFEVRNGGAIKLQDGMQTSTQRYRPESGEQSRAELQLEYRAYESVQLRTLNQRVDLPGMPAMLRPGDRGLPSQIPLGFDVYWRESQNLLQVFAKSEYESITVSYFVPPKDGSPTVRTESERDFAQRLARHFMARVASRRLESPRTESLAGKTVTFRKNSKKNFDHVDIEQWSTAHGWTFLRNPATAVASLTKDGKTLIVPLGSASIKVGSDWKEAGDLVSEIDGRWFVPVGVLAN